MNANWLKINIGDQSFFSVTITEAMATKFVSVTGDNNLLHIDESFAKKKGFAKRVVHGMLLGSLFSTLVGKHFLGDDNLYLSQTLQFRRPVLLGDTVLVKGVVQDKIESAKILRIKTIIESGGEVVLSGEAQVKFNG